MGGWEAVNGSFVEFYLAKIGFVGTASQKKAQRPFYSQRVRTRNHQMAAIRRWVQAMREFFDGQKTRLKLGISRLGMPLAIKSAVQLDANIVSPPPRPFSRWEKGTNPLDLRGRGRGPNARRYWCCSGFAGRF